MEKKQLKTKDQLTGHGPVRKSFLTGDPSDRPMVCGSGRRAMGNGDGDEES